MRFIIINLFIRPAAGHGFPLRRGFRPWSTTLARFDFTCLQSVKFRKTQRCELGFESTASAWEAVGQAIRVP